MQKRYIPCEINDLDASLKNTDRAGHRLIYLVPPPHSGKTNTRITNFLQAIEKSHAEKFVLISTTGVYGDHEENWIDETCALKPTAMWQAAGSAILPASQHTTGNPASHRHLWSRKNPVSTHQQRLTPSPIHRTQLSSIEPMLMTWSPSVKPHH